MVWDHDPKPTSGTPGRDHDHARDHDHDPASRSSAPPTSTTKVSSTSDLLEEVSSQGTKDGDKENDEDDNYNYQENGSYDDANKNSRAHIARDALGEVVLVLRHFYGLQHPLAAALAQRLRESELEITRDDTLHESAVLWAVAAQEKRLEDLVASMVSSRVVSLRRE